MSLILSSYAADAEIGPKGNVVNTALLGRHSTLAAERGQYRNRVYKTITAFCFLYSHSQVFSLSLFTPKIMGFLIQFNHVNILTYKNIVSSLTLSNIPIGGQLSRDKFDRP
jgi:hypothetical protein